MGFSVEIIVMRLSLLDRLSVYEVCLCTRWGKLLKTEMRSGDDANEETARFAFAIETFKCQTVTCELV
jgi:hypothetical protein